MKKIALFAIIAIMAACSNKKDGEPNYNMPTRYVELYRYQSVIDFLDYNDFEYSFFERRQNFTFNQPLPKEYNITGTVVKDDLRYHATLKCTYNEATKRLDLVLSANDEFVADLKGVIGFWIGDIKDRASYYPGDVSVCEDYHKVLYWRKETSSPGISLSNFEIDGYEWEENKVYEHNGKKFPYNWDYYYDDPSNPYL